MATLRDAFRTLLEGDTTFASPLTGGIYDASELPEEGLTPTSAPTAWDAYGTLKPCAIVRWRGGGGFGPHFAGERASVELYVYQVDGIATVETAIRRAKNLLHRTRLTATDYGLCWMNWIGGVGEFNAPEVGNSSGVMVRFEVILIRK